MATITIRKTESGETTSALAPTWLTAFKHILPIYIATHLAFLVISALAPLFIIKDFKREGPPLSVLWDSWNRWDTGHFTFIATHGYDQPMRTAFFPLYPLLMRAIMLVTQSALISGLIVSSIAQLVALVVFFRLVWEDFDQERAHRAILYLSLFPTAFFLVAVYNESLFLCLSLLCFYYLRHGQWWLAGLFGLLASLTRSSGLFLLLPFCYEYLVQHSYKLKNIRWNVLSIALVPMGVALFSLYCGYRFHDFLVFSHVQASYWNRYPHGPWHGIIDSIKAIVISSGPLSFQSLRNLTDLVPDLFMLVLIVLAFVGPWRLPRNLWSYGIYAVGLFLFSQIFPMGGNGFYPLQSTSRFMLEIFPAFIILAMLGKSRMVNLNYLMISGALLFFLLTQFLTGHWVL